MERYFCPTVRAKTWQEAQAQVNNRLQLMSRMLDQISTGAGIPNGRILDDTLTPSKCSQLRNTYVHSDQDSLDASFPFELDFEIVDEMVAIRTVKLSFRIREFRAYATTVPSGGGTTTGTDGGHTTVAGGTHSTPSGGASTSGAKGSASGGGSTTGSQGAASGGGSTSGSETHNHPGSTAVGSGFHTHGITVIDWAGDHEDTRMGDPCQLMSHNTGTIITNSNTATHTHSLNISADGAHTHSTPNHTHPGHTHGTPHHTHPNHTHTTPNHIHTVSNHQHTVSNHQHTVSNHVHSLTFGIYEDSQTPTINVYIDNGSGYGSSIGAYAADQLDIDITDEISEVGFKRVKFTTDVRTRISGWVLCKVDISAEN